MKKRSKDNPIIYAIYFSSLRTIAKRHGYALALHGSLRKDLDLIAVPWVENCNSHFELLKAISKKVGWGERAYTKIEQFMPSKKPHGRTAYVIPTGSITYIDISIIKRIK